MENNSQLQTTEPSSLAKFRNLLSQDVIKKKFEEALGKKAPMFVSNLTTIMSGSAELQKCEHMSVISSALMAASMDLPLTPGLGFAGIVPYWDSPSQSMKAQFQVMKKGFIQLAQRTGLFKIINVSEVYEGELKSHNKFTGEYIFDEIGKKSDNIIGYVSYFRLINGFEKYYYMPIEKLDTHAKRYSKSFQRGKGKWADKEEGGYEQMCEKTVLKLNLSTYAPLSVDINMMNAIVYDQAEIRDVEAKDYDYVDNEESKTIEHKEVLDIGDGKTIVVNKSHEKKSAQMTERTKNVIPDNKFGEVKKDNIQNATIVEKSDQTILAGKGEELVKEIENTESPFIPSRGSVEYMDGKEIKRNDVILPGLEEIEKKETKELLKIVNEDMDMMEASEMIGGKNTKKKLAAIIFAHQNDNLAAYVAKNMPKENTGDAPGSTDEGPVHVDGLISEPNRDFDKQGPKKTGQPADLLLDEKKAGNKYDMAVPEYDKGSQREFSTTKTLFNKMMGITPQITTPRYMDLATKLGLLQKYPDKEKFCRDATVEEIYELLNAN